MFILANLRYLDTFDGRLDLCLFMLCPFHMFVAKEGPLCLLTAMVISSKVHKTICLSVSVCVCFTLTYNYSIYVLHTIYVHIV